MEKGWIKMTFQQFLVKKCKKDKMVSKNQESFSTNKAFQNQMYAELCPPRTQVTQIGFGSPGLANAFNS